MSLKYSLTGNILGGIRDGDLDTKVDLSNNEFTFFSAGSNMGTIDGLGNLTVPRFESQDKFTIDGNQITVSTSGEEAALVANGNAKVFPWIHSNLNLKVANY